MKRLALVMVMAVAGHAQCAPTRAAAVERYRAEAAGTAGVEGFRVVGVRVDRLRLRTWALVEQCGRPELPVVALVLPEGVRVAAAGAAVHTGDVVTVVQAGAQTRMELQGWAEQSGAAKARVRVRLARISEQEDGAAAPRIWCRVVGPGRVEVMQ